MGRATKTVIYVVVAKYAVVRWRTFTRRLACRRMDGQAGGHPRIVIKSLVLWVGVVGHKNTAHPICIKEIINA